MRMIDGDALLRAIDTWDKFGFSNSGAFVREPENDDYVPYVHYDDMVKCVEGMPTIDAVPVRHAKWIWKGEDGDSRFMCSACNWKEDVPTCNGVPDIWCYCPSCGARMDGK